MGSAQAMHATPAERTGGTGAMDIRRKLEQEFHTAVRRLRQLDGAEMIEQAEVGFGDNTPFSDEVDEIQANERREMGFATRELLVDRVNRLAAAIQRLNDGEYGVCT